MEKGQGEKKGGRRGEKGEIRESGAIKDNKSHKKRGQRQDEKKKRRRNNRSNIKLCIQKNDKIFGINKQNS